VLVSDVRLTSAISESNLKYLADVAATAPSGAFVEVGVYRGGSAQRLYWVAERQGRALHLFDTFEGIPHKSEFDHHNVGDFADGVDLIAMREAMPRATFYKGIFPDTLPETLTRIAFVHDDSDQYESTRAVIERLYPKLVPLGIIYFDDYWTPTCPGSRRAIDECGLPLMQWSGNGKICIVKPWNGTVSP